MNAKNSNGDQMKKRNGLDTGFNQSSRCQILVFAPKTISFDMNNLFATGHLCSPLLLVLLWLLLFSLWLTAFGFHFQHINLGSSDQPSIREAPELSFAPVRGRHWCISISTPRV